VLPPVPAEPEPLPGLDVEPLASPLLLLPSPDLLRSSEQPGSAIPRNPDKIIAVSNEICLPIISSFDRGLTVTLLIYDAMAMPWYRIVRVLFEPDYSAAAGAGQALIVRGTSPKSDALAPVVQVVWADSETGVEAGVRAVKSARVTQNRAHLGIRPSRSTSCRSSMNF
jgi:hypothetical protein